MKKNMSSVDRIVRAAVAVLIAILMLTGAISGTLGIVLGIIAVILLATSLIGFCPLYAALGISSRGKEKAAV